MACGVAAGRALCPAQPTAKDQAVHQPHITLPLPAAASPAALTHTDTAAAPAQVGVAFTRFQSRFFQSKYGNLDSRLISYGPCQTPTLNFCVERHQAIACFQPEPFWVVRPRAAKAGTLLNVSRGPGTMWACGVPA